jgi:hypothetical protein
MFTRRHRNKWALLTGVLAMSTNLLQFIPQTWTVWAGIGLTLLAGLATGVAQLLGDGSDS